MHSRPIAETELWDEINAAWERMNWKQRRLWEIIRITPTTWEQHSHGDSGQGVWVVALLGSTVVWYDDIEYGFRVSHYTRYGIIDDSSYGEDKLEQTVQNLLYAIETGIV